MSRTMSQIFSAPPLGSGCSTIFSLARLVRFRAPSGCSLAPPVKALSLPGGLSGRAKLQIETGSRPPTSARPEREAGSNPISVCCHGRFDAPRPPSRWRLPHWANGANQAGRASSKFAGPCDRSLVASASQPCSSSSVRARAASWHAQPVAPWCRECRPSPTKLLAAPLMRASPSSWAARRRC